jgi:hypothetical protein
MALISSACRDERLETMMEGKIRFIARIARRGRIGMFRALLEGFAYTGAAMHGQPVDLHWSREDTSKCEENESLRDEESAGKRSNCG